MSSYLVEFERRHDLLNLEVLNHVFDARNEADWRSAVSAVSRNGPGKLNSFYVRGFVQIMSGYIVELHKLHDSKDTVTYDLIKYMMRNHQEEFAGTTGSTKAMITVVREYLPHYYQSIAPTQSVTFNPNPPRH